MMKAWYDKKINWLQSANVDEITTYLFNRLFLGLDNEIPIHPESPPEDYVEYAHQSIPKNNRQRLDTALQKLLSETLEKISKWETKIRTEYQSVYEGYSNCLFIASSCKVLSMAEPLQERLINKDRISNFGYEKLSGVKTEHYFDSLHQSLLTLLELEDIMNESQKKVLSEKFWTNILEGDELEKFCGVAMRGLGCLNWKAGLEYLPKFINYVNKNKKEHLDIKTINVAAALNFFIQRVTEKPLNGHSLENHMDLISDVLIRNREKNPENWQETRTLLKNTTNYLLEKNDIFSNGAAKSYFEKSIPTWIN